MAPSILIRHLSKTPLSLGFCLILCLVSPGGSQANSAAADDEALKADAQTFFDDRVTPFIKTYCIACHQNRRPTRAGVNFSPALKAPGHAAFTDQWKRAVARVNAHDMPPKDVPQPTDADRRMFAEWLAKLKYLSEKDPGRFVIRRGFRIAEYQRPEPITVFASERQRDVAPHRQPAQTDWLAHVQGIQQTSQVVGERLH